MFWCCYVAWPCDRDLWPFDLVSVSCTVLLMSDPHTNFLLSYDYRLLSYEYWPDSHFRYLKQSLHVCRVTWTLTGGKNSPHFWNPWPQFGYSLSHFHGATTKIKPCYRQKIAFSHYGGYKVYCACAVSRDLCICGPPKPHVTIFWPRIAYSLYNFYAATMTIKGSFILEHPHVKAVFGRQKKTKSSQNRSPKWRFFGNLRVQI